MKIQLPYFLICLVIPFFISCGSIKEPDFKSIENVKVSSFGFNESKLSLNIYYFNPNKFRLKLQYAEGDVWIENNFLGHFVVDTLIRIPAKDEFYLPVKLQVDMSKILKNSVLAFLSKEVKIKIDGRARLGKGFIYINYPIRYEGKQDLEKLVR